MVQSPGLLVADTKLDLAVAPARFLSRATNLWDPIGAGGQLQNQAYGYLWPMGPFFLAGHLAQVPDWAVQRLWWALVMCVAFLGAALLARLLGLRSDLAVVLTGLAYALSPRMLTTLGPISIEAWPSALAPWVLIPLVVGSRRGSPRRAASLSAIAVAMVGGVNAAATFAVLPLGVVWLLTRTPGPRRRSLMRWWPLFTLMGSLWWLVPLFVLGSYSPPFLDFIESAANTTFSTTLFDALRGTSDWVPYVDLSWRAGNDLIRSFAAPIDSAVILFLGLAGLLQRRNPHRVFLVLGVTLGLVMVTAGHLGSVSGWGAGTVQKLLDEGLAPLRNVHKFDPILRLPLVLGMGFAVDEAWTRWQQRAVASAPQDRAAQSARRIRRGAIVFAGVVAVIGASLPLVSGRLAPTGEFSAVPDYWTDAVTWLDEQPGDGQTLLVPGSSFGKYVWGYPRDEPIQFLAHRRPWMVRDAVPLTPPGNIRMLDAVEERFAQGRGSAGMASYLRRSGVRFLVVRNDLERSSNVVDPVLVHQTILGSPGLTRVARFGPDVGGEPFLRKRGQRVVINGGWQSEYPAIEIFRVDGPHDLAVGAADDDVPTVVGGPEDLLELSDLGQVGDGPALLATDVSRPARGSRLVLTDGLRAVERNFGRVDDGVSATLVEGQRREVGSPASDYLPPRAAHWLTYARTTGVREVSASSSTSDANAVGTVEPGQLPYAALDDRSETYWREGFSVGSGGWWQVRLSHPRPVEDVRVTVGPGERQRLRVRTDHEVSTAVSLPPNGTATIRVADAETDRIRVEDVSGRPGGQLSLATVRVAGLDAERVLQLPRVPDPWGDPDAVVLRAVTDARRGCARVDGDVRCVDGRDVSPEEEFEFHRALSLDRARTYGADLRVSVAPGTALAEAVFAQQPVAVRATSSGTRDPRGSVLAAVDGDPSTTWTAGVDDEQPTLDFNWVDTRSVSGLRVFTAPGTAARRPTKLTMTWPGGTREVSLPADGVVRFPAIATRELSLRVDSAEDVRDLGFDSAAQQVPVGISEIRLDGVPYLPVAVPDRRRTLPCGSGPSVTVNGFRYSTSVTARLSDLYDGDSVPAKLCLGAGRPRALQVGLRQGSNRIDVVGSRLLVPQSLVLSNGPRGSGSASSAPATRRGGSEQTIRPPSSADLISVRENSNPGWSARQAGRELEPVLVDGWQQGWRLRGDRQVRATFTPGATYRAGLAVGFALLGALLLVPLVPRRRLVGATGTPASAPRPVPDALLRVVGLLAAGLLAGWTGLAIGVLTLLVAGVLQRKVRPWAPWLLSLAILPAGVGYALRPWGAVDAWAGSMAWPQYLVVVVVVGLFSSPLRRRRA